jgi:hypothetical protein
VLVPRFLGFEAMLVPGHVGAYRCLGDDGGLEFCEEVMPGEQEG